MYYTYFDCKVMQIFYMSELGALILGSDIPVNFGELFVIFIERTIISLVLLAFNKI